MKRERQGRAGARDERWLERHGLERDPFPDAEPGPEFFTRGGRDRLVENLAATSSPAPSLVTVTGDAGVGKSTIFHAMLRTLPGNVHVARISAGVFLSAKHLLTAVSAAIGTDADPDASRPELRRIVHERLQALFAAEARCFVLVDDAGELEADALDELVQLAELEPVGTHLRVVLFAQPGIRDALGKASNFFSVCSAPSCSVFWIFYEVSVLHEFACFFIENGSQYFYWVFSQCGLPASDGVTLDVHHL